MACLALPARAQALFDFEQPAFVERGHLIKDHALIHDGARFHLFYTRSSLDEPGSEPSFGHATSADLRHWEHHAPVLSLQETGFADLSLWAPQVLPIERAPQLAGPLPAVARWAMLFTGVNRAFSQSIGLAWSEDLFEWEMLPERVFRPGAWSDWSDGAWADCRDPYLFAQGDSLYLLASASMADGRAALALGVSGGALPFEDLGPLVVSGDGYALESAFLLVDAGQCWLFLTRGGLFGTSVMTAPSPFGPWDLADGVKIDEGAAPEVNWFDGRALGPAGWAGAGEGGWVFSRHENYWTGSRLYYAIQFDTVNLLAESWPPPKTDRQGVLSGFPGWSWSPVAGLSGPDAFSVAPVFEDNPVVRGSGVASGFEGHGWISSFEKYRSVTGGVASGAGDSLGTAAQGRLRSPDFTIEGDRLDFLLGGSGHADSCWVALHRASDGALLFRSAPAGGAGGGEPGGEGLPLVQRAWDLRGLWGVSVYAEIVDGAQGTGGFIACDHFAYSAADPAQADAPLAATPALGFAVGRIASPWTPSAGPLLLPIRVDRSGHYEATLYDVRGRRLARPSSGHLAAGEHVIAWRPADRIAAGVYFLRWRGVAGEANARFIVLP